ncbi:MAG: MlaE family ABC transporter permease [Thermoguttaceae bacterium]
MNYGAQELTDLDKMSAAPSVLERVYVWVAHQGEIVGNFVEDIGNFVVFAIQVFYWMVKKRVRRDTLSRAMYDVGVLSLPVIMLTGVFIGMVLAVQSFSQFAAMGIETKLGAVINMSLLKELGPVLAATMLAGRVGSSLAAELGTMRVTEQIDAMASMGVSPIYYLVLPRFLACLFLIPVLTLMADFMGVFGAAFYCIKLYGINAAHYWKYSHDLVTLFHMFSGMFKSVFFGSAIALISCYQGFHCRSGAEGVGRAATAAFVWSFVTILILDLLLGIFLDWFYLCFWNLNTLTLFG